MNLLFQDVIVDVGHRSGYHVHSGELTHSAGRLCACVHGGLYGSDVTPDVNRDQSTLNFFVVRESDVGCFHGGIGGFDTADEPERFYHS